MKKSLIVLSLVVLLLSSCTLGGASTSTVDEIKTAIFLTATARASDTPQPPCLTCALTPTNTVPPSATATVTAMLPLPTVTLTTCTTLPTCATPTQIPPVYASPVPVVPAPAGWNPYYADQFIRYYYQHINSRDYATTWSLLTANFKAAVNGPAAGGYTGYVNYWNTVQRVDIMSLYLTNFTGYTSDVTVDMVYNYYNGTITRTWETFHLWYDAGRVTWMFNSYAPAPAPSLSTPVTFIQNYFNNINARNYGLTWSLLTPGFIAANNSSGYADYAAYWNTVARVDVNYVTVNSQTSTAANVTTGLTFTKMDASVVSLSLTYNLLYNSVLGSWQFHTP